MEFVNLIQELNQGRNLAHQLRDHLHPSLSSSSSSSPSSNGILLIDQILRSYENALSVLAGGSSGSGGSGDEEIPPTIAAVKHRDVSKKRKVMAKWSELVKVPSVSAIGALPDDGFSWRKYGQKDILGSKFPRGYFRCSHRFAQGCSATKQVQRSDNDPSMYEITYRGKHTCNKSLHSNTPKQEQTPQLQQHPMPMRPKQEQEEPLQQQDVPLYLTVSSDNVDDSLRRPFCPRSPLFRSEVEDDQSPFRGSELEGLEFWCIGDGDLVSGPSSFTNISMGDLEEYCSLESFC
ncbi:putative WRKY transcription factor 53, partial [Cucurbita argyrosperma subsp. sororia]